jgi:glycolate oxidase iron-sulfur subunit
LLGAAQSIGLFRGKLPRIPLRVGPALKSTSADPDVWIFAGCVMDAWSRPTHRSLARLITATGATYAVSDGGCCGALHHHAGYADDARQQARRIMESMPGAAPILVDSAGCGAAMKDYGHLLGSTDAFAFSSRVLDAHEWLADRLDTIEPEQPIERRSVIVQEPCHLRHVQKSHVAMRKVVEAVADIVDTEDDGLCCGAGGAYALVEPRMAADVRSRKVTEITRVDAGRGLTVVSANPGCAQHLGAARISVVHPLDLVAETILGRNP